jgi:hypothetical protein
MIWLYNYDSDTRRYLRETELWIKSELYLQASRLRRKLTEKTTSFSYKHTVEGLDRILLTFF